MTAFCNQNMHNIADISKFTSIVILQGVLTLPLLAINAPGDFITNVQHQHLPVAYSEFFKTSEMKNFANNRYLFSQKNSIQDINS